MQSDNHNESKNEILHEVENTDEKTEENLLDATYKILSFRSHAPDCYKSFVYATWMNSLRYGNEFFRLMDSATYYKAYGKYIDSVLARRGSRLKVAVLSEDEDVALGWAVDEGDVLHYVFVKDMRESINGKRVGESLRRKGIAKSLIEPDIKTISHITQIGLSLWNDKAPHLKLNPFV